jgi:hypothetical protein
VLTEFQRRRYARQVVLRELGPAGQARLCASTAALFHTADARAAEVARDYLQRAGLQLREPAAEGGESDQAGQPVRVDIADSQAVRACAGASDLEECAAWLLGAWAAVETIKQAADVGMQAQASSLAALVLNAEVL